MKPTTTALLGALTFATALSIAETSHAQNNTTTNAPPGSTSAPSALPSTNSGVPTAPPAGLGDSALPTYPPNVSQPATGGAITQPTTQQPSQTQTDQRTLDSQQRPLNSNSGAFGTTTNGSMDPQTRSEMNGLRGSGIENMNRPNTSGVGIMSGDPARAAQSALNSQMNLTLREDGIVGSQTTTAIRDFQVQNGLPASGILDSATLEALGVSTDSIDRTPASVPPQQTQP